MLPNYQYRPRFHTETRRTLSILGKSETQHFSYQVASGIDSVEGLSWGSINVEGETLPLQTRIAEGHQFPD